MPRPVDHGRVRIGADQRVGIINTLAVAQHALGQVLEIDLMDDADARGDDFERFKGLPAPLKKLIALAVALEFEIEIFLKRVSSSREIHLDRMIDG